MLALRTAWLSVATTLLVAGPLAAQAGSARIREETRTIATYPFSEPNPIPILTRDTRLYPYHSFEGYAATSTPKPWKVVTLENDWIEVFVLPEVGGKVWGAVVKATGHEFIYRNEVLKFRNIALRGPWTSGGIEFNFGVIGHTPSTATPVDYVLRENDDGSVSCIVGMMDLPSRTHWRVEVRLPADKATFETNVLWYNPTPLEQPYYNWMTAAAPARPDLTVTIPGNAFLGHPGNLGAWPTSPDGRVLPRYAENNFGGNKSYHVVGALNEFFGGYLSDAGYGFGHWAPHDEMPGQKLWLWSLARDGGIWEDLLTDTDGQYVEYQAGRLLVQYQPSGEVNPIAQAGFDPGATDRWSETWFPLEGTGGLSEASREGALYAEVEAGQLTVTISSFGLRRDTLQLWVDGRQVQSVPLSLDPLVPVAHRFPLAPGAAYRVHLPRLGLDHSSDPTVRALSRPWTTDSAAMPSISPTDRLVTSARQLALGRRYPEAREQFERALASEPWNRQALLGMAELEYRRGRYEAGLEHATRLLQLDTYDAEANFIAGILYRASGKTIDAIDALGWAARSMRYRSAANAQLADVHLASGALADAERHARRALDYDRFNLSARQVLAMVARQRGDVVGAETMRSELLEIDPLHHFVEAERFLAAPPPEAGTHLREALRGEYPDQVILELAIDYVRRGARDDALRILALGRGAELEAWRAWLSGDKAQLGASAAVAFAFPYRPETLPVLAWAAGQEAHWSWRYLLALNLWACDRPEEAADILAGLDGIDDAPALVARATLLERVRGQDPEADLRRAVTVDPSNRTVLISLVQYLRRVKRWGDAVEVSDRGRARFVGDFNLELLHAGSLVQLGRADDALAILAKVQVLPSEHARDSHKLYEQAHTLAALDALDRGATTMARQHLEAALQWPEHLGQGRPYQPEERLVRYLLGIAASRAGNPSQARAEWQAVIDASRPSGGTADRLALLATMARARLGVSAIPAVPSEGLDDLDRRLLHRALGVRP